MDASQERLLKLYGLYLGQKEIENLSEDYRSDKKIWHWIKPWNGIDKYYCFAVREDSKIVTKKSHLHIFGGKDMRHEYEISAGRNGIEDWDDWFGFREIVYVTKEIDIVDIVDISR